MKKIIVLLLMSIMLVSCSPQAPVIPTATSVPSETSTPTPTSTFTPIPTITFTPTATLEPSLVTFDIKEGVLQQDILDIQTGLDLIRVYLRDYMGGDILPDFQKKLKIKLVATGLGDPDPAGSGSCCNFSSDGTRIFFDTKHIHWTRIGQAFRPFKFVNEEHIKTMSHEYVHAWQSSLGCLSNQYQPFGFWMSEGIAEYTAYQPLIQHGIIDKDVVKRFMLSSAEFTGESYDPLQSFEPTNRKVWIWPGHIGYIAIDYLISETKVEPIALRFICEQTMPGMSAERAFKNVFGISKQDFYLKFADYIKTLK